MSKTFKRIGMDCSTVILIFPIPTVFIMFHQNPLKNINLNTFLCLGLSSGFSAFDYSFQRNLYYLCVLI